MAGPHPFRNDRSLSRAEIETVVKWVDAGAPEGDPIRDYAPPARESGWKLGKPDLVIQVPGFQVPKSGVVPYSFLIVPKHFDRDTWVEAAEFRVDKRAVIHHMNAFVRPPGSSYLAGFPDREIFVPTVAERAGDFSALPGLIYDPATLKAPRPPTARASRLSLHTV